MFQLLFFIHHVRCLILLVSRSQSDVKIEFLFGLVSADFDRLYCDITLIRVREFKTCVYFFILGVFDRRGAFASRPYGGGCGFCGCGSDGGGASTRSVAL